MNATLLMDFGQEFENHVKDGDNKIYECFNFKVESIYWRPTFTFHLICIQSSESAFVKRSAAGMLSGKRPVQSVVRLHLLACKINIWYYFLCMRVDMYNNLHIPACC